MTDHRSFARTVIALSLAVLAACAVVVTIKVAVGPLAIEPPRVLDQTALEKRVAAEAGVQMQNKPGAYVDCPLSVVVKVGTKFACRVWGDTNPATVRVEITSDQGDLTVTSD
ncbi:DUF4333 domain-containing protein [Streptomyces sp. NPDC002574]|uniref:DUF4333 domain-containing protein n=1 Tax=Streptomyces sp. NPDC002574 TaxID=3364652 RepID=UPI0036A10B76